jgi:Glycine rich protein
MAIKGFELRRRATASLCALAGGALIGALLVAASPGTASAVGCATVGSQVTCTFSYNGTNGSDGTPQSFVVPTAVTSVTIETWGAQGGLNATSDGLGGHVKGTFTVTPAETLTVRVGGQPTTAGGYNGGGTGGVGPTSEFNSGGGGGASDVRRGGDALTNRVIVAGGGGGVGGPFALQGGGTGGGPSGGAGVGCDPGQCTGGGSAQGGTGGTSSCANPPGGSSTNGGSGSPGAGGAGGSATCSTTLGLLTFFGGGGGGGLFGGGGGAAQEVLIGTTPTQVGAGGGGGSGFVAPSASSQTNQAGVRSGNGAVTITYTVPSLPGNIFSATFTQCTTMHVGYNRFVNGTVVYWSVTSDGFGTVASGQFTAIGGGTLGSKTYHFIDIPLGTTLHPEPVQSHIHMTWAGGGRFYATRDPGC